MKHRLAALFLTAALFCTLLAGCSPTPDVPGPNGGSSSSGSTNNGGNSESEDNNNTNSPKLQPSVAMTYNIHPSFEENSYRVSYVFTVANPNKVYSTKVRFSMTLKDAAGITDTDYTFPRPSHPATRFVFLMLRPIRAGVRLMSLLPALLSTLPDRKILSAPRS